MNRNEQQMYSDITSIRNSLEKIANALESNSNKNENITAVTPTGNTIYYKSRKDMYMDNPCTKEEYEAANDIPGFEGTLDALDNLYQPSSTRKAILEQQALNRKIAEKENEYKYVSKVGKIKNDSDFEVRQIAKQYEDEFLANGHTKKDCILDYVTENFGPEGARYTDIIKFAYYLGAHNTLKFNPTDNRGYYACALTHGRWNTGHLVTGGKDQLVKGINEDGKERYFTLSFVNNVTDYWKRLDQ